MLAANEKCFLDEDCHNLDEEFSFLMYCEIVDSQGKGNCVLDDVAVNSLGLCVDDSWCSEDQVCGETQICEDLVVEIQCNAIIPCEEGECVGGVCVVEDLEVYGLDVACLTNADCEYVDDVCYEGLCYQAAGFPASIDVGGEKIFLEDKVCVEDSDCGFREFCDVGLDVDGKHYCSITSGAAETDVTIDSLFDPLADTYDATLIAFTGDDVKKVELEARRFDRLQKSARQLNALAAKGKVDVKKVEKKFAKAEERLDSIDGRVGVLRTSLSSGVSSEEKRRIESRVVEMQGVKVSKQLDFKRDLGSAATSLRSQNLVSNQRKLEVKDKLGETKLSTVEKRKKEEVVKKRTSDYSQRIEKRKLSTPKVGATRSSVATDSGSGVAPEQRPPQERSGTEGRPGGKRPPQRPRSSNL